mmetsp:Transcript_30731/g.64804  ORF Transcript_30731/g.64804 Transcript_30731/m.64804 type:complete len:667 (+) Transcript_30731:92-2092(+)
MFKIRFFYYELISIPSSHYSLYCQCVACTNSKKRHYSSFSSYRSTPSFSPVRQFLSLVLLLTNSLTRSHFRSRLQKLPHHFGLLVPKRHTIRESHAAPVIPADPQPLRRLLHLLQLRHDFQMSQLVLRNGRRPHFHPQHLRLLRVSFQQDLSQILVHRPDDVLFFHRSDGRIARPPDVIQQNVIIVGTPSGEETRTPQRAQGSYPLRTGMEQPESRKGGELPEVVGEIDVSEGGAGIGERHGRDGGIVDPPSINGVADSGKEGGRGGKDRFEDRVGGVGREGGDHGFGADGLRSRRGGEGGEVAEGGAGGVDAGDAGEGPFQFDAVAQFLLDGLRQGGQAVLVTAGIAVFEFHPLGFGRVGLSLLGQFHLAGQPPVENGAEFVPLDVVRVLLDPRDFGQRRLHRERGRIAGVHPADERVDDPREDLLAQDPRHPVPDRLLGPVGGRGGVPRQRPHRRANLAGPGEQIARQSEFQNSVGAEEQFQLSPGALSALSFGEGVQFAVVVDPGGEGFVGEDQLVLDVQLVGDPHDGGLRGEGIGAVLEEEGAVGVGVEGALDVAAEVGAGFRQEDVEAAAIAVVVAVEEVVGESGAGDASADDEAVDRGGGGGRGRSRFVGRGGLETARSSFGRGRGGGGGGAAAADGVGEDMVAKRRDARRRNGTMQRRR